MIQITAHMKILVAVEPVDFRRGIDGLAAVCRQVLETDPMTGTLFVFCSRRRTAIKCLVYDTQGFWLCQKRLSAGRFKVGPRAKAASWPGIRPTAILLWNAIRPWLAPARFGGGGPGLDK